MTSLMKLTRLIKISRAINKFNSIGPSSACHGLLSRMATHREQSAARSIGTGTAKFMDQTSKFDLELETFKSQSHTSSWPRTDDLLIQSFKKCDNLNTLFDMVRMHSPSMLNNHISAAFGALHDIIKGSNDPDRLITMVRSSKEFNQLCNVALKKLHFFEPKNTIMVLKSLSLIKMDMNTGIMKGLMKMIQEQLNDFSISDIIFLDFLIKMTNRSLGQDGKIPQLEALAMALPLVFQLKMDSKEIDFENIDLVIRCLCMSVGKGVNSGKINQLLLALRTKQDKFTPHQAFRIASCLASENVGRNFSIDNTLLTQIMKECFEILTNNVAENEKLIMNLLINLSHKHRRTSLFFDEKMFKVFEDLATKNIQKLKPVLIADMIRYFTQLKYFSPQLLNEFAELIVEQPQMILNYRFSVPEILRSYALSSEFNFKPGLREKFLTTVLDETNLEFYWKSSPYCFVWIVYHLAIMNHYPTKLISDTLGHVLDDVMANSSARQREDMLSMLLCIHAGINLESKIESSVVDECNINLKKYVEEGLKIQKKSTRENSESTIKYFLEQALGGQGFVSHNVSTGYGVIIPHLIVLRSGGYPVAISNSNQDNFSLDDLDTPPDCQKIAIIPMDYHDYCRHPNLLRGRSDFRLRMLKQMGILPLPIQLEVWDKLIDREKIPYLMKAIRNLEKDEAAKSRLTYGTEF